MRTITFRLALSGFSSLLALIGGFTSHALAAAPQVAVGGYTSMAVDSQGQLYGWGDNNGGLLGRVEQAYAPVSVPSSAKFTNGFSGGKRLFLLDSSNNLWAAGGNAYGQLGDGTFFLRRTGLVKVGTGYKDVAVGTWHTVGIKTDGSLWAWGNNDYGQLGDGGYETRNIASRVNLGEVISAAAGSEHTLAVLKDGSLWAWGRNDYGQLGDGSKATRATPFKLGDGYVQVAAGRDYSLARKVDGSVWAWGRNDFGQLGDGSKSARLAPVAINGRFSYIAASHYTSYALNSDGDLWQWGDALIGSGSQTVPQRVAQGIKALRTGDAHLLVQKVDGSVWAAGSNQTGELGIDDPDTYRASDLRQVSAAAVAIAAGGGQSLAIAADGSAKVWGDNSEGQLALGRDDRVSVPIPLASQVKQLALSDSVAYVIRDDNTLWGWGRNHDGRLGDGTTRDHAAPVKIGDGFVAVSSGNTQSFAIKADGSLWAWGDNTFGQLGVGDVQNRNVPTYVGNGYRAVSAGAVHTIALRVDGTLWTWGRNQYGQLGNGVFETRFGGQANPSPIKIGNGYTAIKAGAHHNLALRIDGSVWAWGWNDYGQVGDGSLVSRATPVQVASEIDSLLWADISNAIKARDGKTYVWGYNSSPVRAYNMLLTGSTEFVVTPRVLAGDWQAAAIGSAHAIYLRRDGTPFSVGYQQFGQLGDGSFDSKRQSLAAVLAPPVDGLLDLQPGTAKTTTASEIPPVLVKTYRQGADSNLSLGVQLFLPASSSANRFAAAGYNIYVAASLPAGNARQTVQWFVLQSQQQYRSPTWQGFSSPLAAYLENVSSSSSALVTLDVLANIDINLLAGAQLYIGYGLNADEMLQAKRYRAFFAVPNE